MAAGYARDLIDLYQHKKWMREHAANALIEHLAALHAAVAAAVADDVLAPAFFLADGAAAGSAGAPPGDREAWRRRLTPEQVAVALHLQTRREAARCKYPLDEPLLTAATVPALADALASTSRVAVRPRGHVVWDALWGHLTEVGEDGRRRPRDAAGFPAVVDQVVEHVVVGRLLGRGEATTAGPTNPTHERRALALHVVGVLCGAAGPTSLALAPRQVAAVLRPEVVEGAFADVLGAGFKKPGGAEHHLRPRTAAALDALVARCGAADEDAGLPAAVAAAFLRAEPRFDAKTKTRTVASLLMLDDDERGSSDADEGAAARRDAIWQSCLSFLEEEMVAGREPKAYVELAHKLAKRDLATAPAAVATRVLRFFMAGAFLDCAALSDPVATEANSSKTPKKKKKKKKEKAQAATEGVVPPGEIAAGLRVRELLRAHGTAAVPRPVRALMAARFYSLLSDVVSATKPRVWAEQGRASPESGGRAESVHRALAEVCGILSLLETSGATRHSTPSSAEDAEDAAEASRQAVLRLQQNANDALVRECDGAGDKGELRARAAFAAGGAALAMSLSLQLNGCGALDDGSEEEEEEDNDEDEVADAVHEFIADLDECVHAIGALIKDESSFRSDDDGNPLAAMASLLVNILSSPVGGEVPEKGNPIQASAAKLTREMVKLAWAGLISAITGLHTKNATLVHLVDADFMSTLVESVCGEKAMTEEDGDEDNESMESVDSSAGDLDDGGVFADAAESGMDLEKISNNTLENTKKKDEESSEDSGDDNTDHEKEIELDPSKLENLLLEDGDAEMSDSGAGILEHHAGADKALAALIKLRQETRKESHIERGRLELCTRLRCAALLDSLFAAPVFKSGWLPIEAVLGSLVPLLRSRKALARSIQASSIVNVKKSLNERNALVKHLSALVREKISKFRGSDLPGAGELALKASSDIWEELMSSLNGVHCSCCSVALITAVRCIPNVEENADVKAMYVDSVREWSSRKATKIHACVFNDLIQRMPR